VTECAKCGDCCDHIYLRPSVAKLLREWGAFWRSENPSVERLVAAGWERDTAEACFVNERLRANSTFVAEHWTVIEDKETGPIHSCDRFDSETRLCMAHDERPPICSGFPWYGEDPAEVARKAADEGGVLFSKRCSFVEDVPVTLRAKVTPSS